MKIKFVPKSPTPPGIVRFNELPCGSDFSVESSGNCGVYKKISDVYSSEHKLRNAFKYGTGELVQCDENLVAYPRSCELLVEEL